MLYVVVTLLYKIIIDSPGYADGGIGSDGNGMEQLLMLKVPENNQKKDSTCSYDSAVELVSENA